MKYAFHLLLWCCFLYSSQSYGQLRTIPSSMDKRIDSLTAIIKGEATDLQRLSAYKRLSYDLARTDSTSAKLYIKDGIELANRLGEEESRLWLDCYQGLLFSYYNNFDQAINYFIKLSERTLKKEYQL